MLINIHISKKLETMLPILEIQKPIASPGALVAGPGMRFKATEVCGQGLPCCKKYTDQMDTNGLIAIFL